MHFCEQFRTPETGIYLPRLLCRGRNDEKFSSIMYRRGSEDTLAPRLEYASLYHDSRKFLMTYAYGMAFNMLGDPPLAYVSLADKFISLETNPVFE